MQICTSPQTDNYASIPPLNWMPFLPPNQPKSTTLHPFNGHFSMTTWVNQHQKGRTILGFNEARDDGVAVASAGPYANCLHLAPDR